MFLRSRAQDKPPTEQPSVQAEQPQAEQLQVPTEQVKAERSHFSSEQVQAERLKTPSERPLVPEYTADLYAKYLNSDDDPEVAAAVDKILDGISNNKSFVDARAAVIDDDGYYFKLIATLNPFGASAVRAITKGYYGEPVTPSREEWLSKVEAWHKRKAREQLQNPEFLDNLRHQHVDFLAGKYQANRIDRYFFELDEDFYSSEAYSDYYDQETLAIVSQRPDIYHPSEAEVQAKVDPFLKRIDNDAALLKALTDKLDFRRPQSFTDLVGFISDRLDIQHPPQISLEKPKSDGPKGYRTHGNYDHNNHLITIFEYRDRSTTELLSTIAHELWHAYQHEAADLGNEVYATNCAHYVSAQLDYDTYYSQILEAEATTFGDTVGKIYRKRNFKKVAQALSKYMFNKETNE